MGMRSSLLRTVLAAAAIALLCAADVKAHGSTLSPVSRNYACRYLDRASEPCANAWQANPQALYDWMAFLIARADGRHRQLIPDGQLCSAGDARYAAFDRPSPNWLATALRPGRQTFRWVNNAPHATLYYRFYLTRPGHDPRRALRWDDLELIHDSGPRPAAVLDRFEVDVPQRSGRHVLFGVWQRSDSPEAFYACSDVVFGARGDLPTEPPMPDESRNQPGSGGGHEGHGGGQGHEGHGGRHPAPTPARPTPAQPRRLSAAGIRLHRKVDDDWGAGYCATVTVTNRSRRARAWKATMPLRDRIDSSWNVVARARGGRVSVRGRDYNRTLTPGARTTFGFCATR